ncbi:hypothetical protein CKY10_07275 [Photorhabdus sp. HUG-39]|nr:hypothetical protein CKY10_07275 [Photorhabdus sp. HUG-39]
MKVSFILNQNRVGSIITKTFFKVLSIFLTSSLLETGLQLMREELNISQKKLADRIAGVF